jgi:hypothetical protein
MADGQGGEHDRQVSLDGFAKAATVVGRGGTERANCGRRHQHQTPRMSKREAHAATELLPSGHDDAPANLPALFPLIGQEFRTVPITRSCEGGILYVRDFAS